MGLPEPGCLSEKSVGTRPGERRLPLLLSQTRLRPYTVTWCADFLTSWDTHGSEPPASHDLLHLLHRGDLSHGVPRFHEEFAERLGPVFDEITRRDRKARRTARFHKRHRLPVLLQVVEEWERRRRQRLPWSPFAALGEVDATIELLRAWESAPHFGPPRVVADGREIRVYTPGVEMPIFRYVRR